MAKVVVSFDTDDKYVEVKVGGKVLENVNYVNFSKRVPMGYMEGEEESDEFMCYISQVGEEKDGLIQYVQTCAGRGEIKSTSFTKDKIAQAIQDYLRA